MLGDFLVEAAKNSVKEVCLYTDISSNWMFYEKMGFDRLAEFYDNELSFLLQKKTMSFVYTKKILPKRQDFIK